MVRIYFCRFLSLLAIFSILFLPIVSWGSRYAQGKGVEVASNAVIASFDQARLLAKNGESRRAIELFTSIVKKQPDLIPAFVGRGTAQFDLQKFQAAKDDFDRAVSLAEPNTPIWARSQFLSNQAELELRLRNWTRRPQIRCEETIPKFPSKMSPPDNNHPRWSCDSGDMNLFNGMLCSVGVAEACLAVKNGQSRFDGSWWRAPNKIDKPVAGQTTFNSDQALGTYLYLLQRQDSSALVQWLDWISKNPICNSISTECGWPGQPRFCSNSGDCGFHAIDCGIVLLLGEIFGEQTRAIQLCGGALLMGLATPQQMTTWLDDGLKLLDTLRGTCEAEKQKLIDLATKNGLPVPFAPPCPDFRSVSEPIVQKFQQDVRQAIDAQARLHRLLRRPGPGLAIAYENALLQARINAQVNEKSEPRHLAGTALYVLRKLSPSDPRISHAALPLLNKADRNPFFIFLTAGSGGSEMLQRLLDRCPTLQQDPNNTASRFQWSWEREDNENTTPTSMYWECIFAANLWKGNGGNVQLPRPDDRIGIEAFRFAKQQEDLLRSSLQSGIQEALGRFRDVTSIIALLKQGLEIPASLAGSADKRWGDLDNARKKFCSDLKINNCPPLPFPIPIPGFN